MKKILLTTFIFFALPLMVQASVVLDHSNTSTLSNGLVGYWPLDGATTNWKTGITNDLSGQGNTGSLIAMSTTTSPVAGKVGGALQFKSAASQYVNVPSATVLDPTSPPNFSLVAWVKKATTGGIGPIVNKNGNLAFAIGVSPCTSNQVKLTKYSVVDICIGTFPPDTKYHQLAATWSSSGVTLYIDGVVNATSNNTANFASSALPFTIGYDSSDSVYFNGTIDDVRAYNRALSASEVAQLYTNGGGVIAHSNTVLLSSGLVGYWPLDGATTNWKTGITNDLSGQGNTGSLIAMSTTTSPVAGKIGSALNFTSAAAQEISLGTTPASLTFAYNQLFSISLWAKPSATVGSGIYDRLVSITATGGKFEYFMMANNSEFSFNVGKNGIGDASVAGSTFTVGQWYHVVGVYDGTNVALYINGVKIGIAAYTYGALSSPDGVLSLGGGGSTGNTFSGSLDDVRIYNRALSGAEVAQLYTNGGGVIAHSNTVTLSSSLIGYWPFDGNTTNWATGKTNDTSGSGNNLSFNVMSTTTSPVAGKAGQALKFNGTSQFLSHSNISAFSNFGTGDFSVAFWIKPGSSWGSTTRGIIGQKTNDTSPGWQIYHDSGDTNSIRFRMGDASGNGSDLVGVAVSPNVWTYVVVERKSGVLNGYANGAPSGTSISNTKNISGSTANFNIGYADTWTAYYQGSLDDVHIYNRALSAAEVAQLYASTK